MRYVQSMLKELKMDHWNRLHVCIVSDVKFRLFNCNNV